MRLLAHRQRQEQEKQLAGDQWHEYNLVFPTPIGTPLDPHRLLDVYKEFLKEAGLPDCRLRDLRHTAATFILGWGIHPDENRTETVQYEADISWEASIGELVRVRNNISVKYGSEAYMGKSVFS